jgi:hypothetical protein
MRRTELAKNVSNKILNYISVNFNFTKIKDFQQRSIDNIKYIKPYVYLTDFSPDNAPLHLVCIVFFSRGGIFRTKLGSEQQDSNLPIDTRTL